MSCRDGQLDGSIWLTGRTGTEIRVYRNLVMNRAGRAVRPEGAGHTVRCWSGLAVELHMHEKLESKRYGTGRALGLFRCRSQSDGTNTSKHRKPAATHGPPTRYAYNTPRATPRSASPRQDHSDPEDLYPHYICQKTQQVKLCAIRAE